MSPSMSEPLQMITPQTCNAKTPPLNCPSKSKPPGACTWKISLKYKVKQSKNGKFTSNYKASPIDFETQISLHIRAFKKFKPRGLFQEFYCIRLKTSSLSFSVCKDILQQFSCYMSWVRDRTRHGIEMGSGDHMQEGSLGTDFYRMLDHYMFVRQMKSAR